MPRKLTSLEADGADRINPRSRFHQKDAARRVARPQTGPRIIVPDALFEHAGVLHGGADPETNDKLDPFGDARRTATAEMSPVAGEEQKS